VKFDDPESISGKPVRIYDWKDQDLTLDIEYGRSREGDAHDKQQKENNV